MTLNTLLLRFFSEFLGYLIEVIPGLVFGLLLSGLVHELMPGLWIRKKLGKSGIKPVFYATIIGMFLPLCSWGAIPVSISFYKKGARLGPVLSFLVASPMTSIFSMVLTYKILGFRFAAFHFFSVMIIGVTVGLVGNLLRFKCNLKQEGADAHSGLMTFNIKRRTFKQIFSSLLKFTFIDMVREIGPQIFLGIIIAAAIATITPWSLWIRHGLAGLYGYLFSLIFGLIMCITSVTSIILVDTFIKLGLSNGAGMVFLLAAPVTTYSTILVLKKEFGMKLLVIYLALIGGLSLLFGYLFSLLPPLLMSSGI